MDRSNVINLISTELALDEYGVQRATEKSEQVFCSVESVTASEVFEGGRNGLDPEFRFTMFEPDYSGHTIVEYKGKRYGVYRTYRGRNDTIELYCERMGGVT